VKTKGEDEMFDWMQLIQVPVWVAIVAALFIWLGL
jgi:hypothetical protein